MVKRGHRAAGCIFLAAFLLRIFDLGRFPLNHDEANRILAGADHFTYFLGIPVSCFKGYVWPFASLLVSFSRHFFISPEYIVRIPTAVFGASTVVLVYLSCKRAFGRLPAAFSALLMTFLPWHIYQSRDGREMVYTPFFGALLFLIFLLCIKNKSRRLFFLFCFLLGASSFYTYGASLTHLFVFSAVIAWERKEFSWLSGAVLFSGILISIATIVPIVFLQARGEIVWATFRAYHKNPFSGPLFLNLWRNLSHNLPIQLKTLFISSKGKIIYAFSFRAPLLISVMSAAAIIFALFKMAVRRSTPDKAVMVWLACAFIGGCMFMSFSHPDYIIAALVPLVILFGAGLVFFYDVILARIGKLPAVLLTGLAVASLLAASLSQSIDFYRHAPLDREVCRRNSYGCREAALFLSRIPGIDKCSVTTGVRMTTGVYLDYFIGRRGCGGTDKTRYHVVWAPPSQPQNDWDALCVYRYKEFNWRYPGKSPLYTAAYPDGAPALYVYAVSP